ncbi:MAG: OmpA family protein [Ignavibacteria bacterium]|nr:OmpA family protein [Ignavibacteria bacterium]
MIIILVFAVLLSTATAQDDLRPRYGLNAGVGIAFHSSDFTGLPNVPSCCPGYESGTGLSPVVMAVGMWPMSSSLLMRVRLGYAPLSGSISREEAPRMVVGGVVVDGMFEHNIDVTLNAISLEPTVSAHVAGPMFIDGGVRLSMFPSPAYAQKEEIISPSTSGTFLDPSGADSRSRTRNVYSGEMPSTSFHAAITLALRAEFPLNVQQSLLLVPEIAVGYGLTNIGGVDWKVHPFRAGITVLWQPTDEKPLHMNDAQVPPPPVVPAVVAQNSTIIPLPKNLDVSLGAFTRSPGGTLDTLERIVIDETISEQITAVLPMIFFQHGNDEIPSRYSHRSMRDVPVFNKGELFGKGALDVYHNIINLIGVRMREHPRSTIQLTGCVMPDSIESTSSGLARRRAEHVRDLLVAQWGIEPQRIIVEARELPAQPSSVRHDDGRSENRRVDISSDDPSILDLVRVEDTLRTSSAQDIVLRIGVVSDTTITSWSLRCFAGTRQLLTQGGSGSPPTEISIPFSSPFTEDAIRAELIVVNDGGRQRIAESTIPVEITTLAKKAERRMGLKRIDEYGLILFAFGKASLEGPNARILDLIRSRIEPASSVIVRGHADRTGSAEVNLRLTQERAEAVGAALKHPRIDARGVGQKNMLYDNELPEGRFYNRTVRVRVETPIAP